MKRRKGFTLIELLVVVAIIAMLIAILMPSLAKAKEQAKAAACASNMRQVTLGMSLYAQENADVLPRQHFKGLNSDIRDWSALVTMMLTGTSLADLNSTLTNGGAKMFRCPDDVYPRTTSTGAPRSYVILNCDQWSYRINGYKTVWPYSPWDSAANDFKEKEPIKKLSQVPPYVVLTAEITGQPDKIIANHVFVGIAEIEAMKDNIFTRLHNNGGNFACADGHVEWRAAGKMNNYRADTPYGPDTNDPWKWYGE